MEGCAIDKSARKHHVDAMRFVALLVFSVWAGSALADPRTGQCSTGKWGHVQCIRPDHFVHDTCNAIEVFSKRHGLDTGFFARLIWQESRFDPNALSHADARGIAQFIPSTAHRRGLKDPYNPADALEHSAQYLAEMVAHYGNEGLAAIGYNGGERRAQGFIQGKGLAPETVNYVPLITGLAAEQWRDAPPKAPDFRLAPDKTFYSACSEMATKRRLTPIKRATQASPPLMPWGVQLGFGITEQAARTKVKAQTASCSAQVTPEKMDLIYIKNRVSGRKGYYFARIGRDTRLHAQDLCNSLRHRNCSCLVVQNK